MIVKYLTDSCHIVQSNCCEAFYKHCVVLYCMCYLTEISCVLHGWKYIQKSHIRRGHDVYTSCLPVSSAAEDIERGRLRKLKQFQNYITFQLQSPIIFFEYNKIWSRNISEGHCIVLNFPKSGGCTNSTNYRV